MRDPLKNILSCRLLKKVKNKQKQRSSHQLRGIGAEWQGADATFMLTLDRLRPPDNTLIIPGAKKIPRCRINAGLLCSQNINFFWQLSIILSCFKWYDWLNQRQRFNLIISDPAPTLQMDTSSPVSISHTLNSCQTEKSVRQLSNREKSEAALKQRKEWGSCQTEKRVRQLNWQHKRVETLNYDVLQDYEVIEMQEKWHDRIRTKQRPNQNSIWNSYPPPPSWNTVSIITKLHKAV